MMVVKLVPHRLEYAQTIFTLSTDPPVKEALGLKTETVEETMSFVRHMIEEEEKGNSISRVILNGEDEVVGVTTLKNINYEQKRCHIGSWLGYSYWGKGYNQEAKKAILKIAFKDLDLEHVFTGANKANIRSCKALEKLPYLTLNVESQFPEEYETVKHEIKQACVLHMIDKKHFLDWLYE
ncbi:RimJ/RimL family protein N-acetyltransferase [Croceifilum oryzae]|uniref:RimJ/RimL family protein N-acetyltransferase n=1 Tax=Croceifilum oryzae TaxID=1553429 RepID=A0AAJ1TGA5_9BACL|nr:GNAT family N-acetyltransferase [Croceifilum oryzae]MDQ0417974.1 RimJ/RimL family protein N-acetyltransferase [Croceifilum oryzae]